MRQQLRGELKNTPTDTPRVCSTVNRQLNKEETLSVEGKLLTRNNPEVDESQHTERRKVIVYVLSVEGRGL